jgi:5-methylcytosine-specific restriction endonuclease McrA
MSLRDLSKEPARTITKEMQLISKRLEPPRGVSSQFSKKTRKIIVKRDNGLCVRCKAPYQEIHHVIFRSSLGKGTVDNGVCICGPCHIQAHKHNNMRRWFERYREKNLLNEKAE